METVQGGVPPYGVKETLVVNGKYLICSLSVTIAHHLRYKAYYVFEQFPKSHLDTLTVRSRYA